MIVYWDAETYSQCNLKERGAHVYAGDPTTDVFFFCYAVDDGDVQVWRRDDPVPIPFANPSTYRFVSDNWEFERTIHARILVERYGFPPIPIENQDCAQRLALASAYPAELGLRCEALGLPYRKDPEARKAMIRLSRPQTAKKRKKPVDPAARELISRSCWSAANPTLRQPVLLTTPRDYDRCCRRNGRCSYTTQQSMPAAFTPTCHSWRRLTHSRSRSATPSTHGSTT
jgi:hypothetical protein